jgi:hypothetical protein
VERGARGGVCREPVAAERVAVVPGRRAGQRAEARSGGERFADVPLTPIVWRDDQQNLFAL